MMCFFCFNLNKFYIKKKSNIFSWNLTFLYAVSPHPSYCVVLVLLLLLQRLDRPISGFLWFLKSKRDKFLPDSDASLSHYHFGSCCQTTKTMMMTIKVEAKSNVNDIIVVSSCSNISSKANTTTTITSIFVSEHAPMTFDSVSAQFSNGCR